MEEVTNKEIKEFDGIIHELLYATYKGLPFVTRIINEVLTENNEPDLRKEYSGVTAMDSSMIAIICNHPGIVIKELLEILGVPKSTLTNAINRLEAKDFIHRVMNQKDRRSYGLTATDKGIKINKYHIRVEKKIWAVLLGCLTTEEREIFTRSLRKISSLL